MSQSQRTLPSVRSDPSEALPRHIFHAILNAIAEGVVVAGADGRLAYINPAAKRLLGQNAAKANLEDWPRVCRIRLPDQVTLFPAGEFPLVKAIRGEIVDETEAYIARPGRSGGIWISIAARPLLNRAAQLVGGVAVFRDISDRTRTGRDLRHAHARLAAKVAQRTAELAEANRILQQSEDFNRAVLRSLEAHIAVLDRDGRIIAVNEAWNRFAEQNRLTPDRAGPGVDYLETCRRSAARSESARQALKGIGEVLQGKRASFTLIYPCHSLREKRWCQLCVTPLLRPDGGAVIAHRDITTQVETEQRLQLSEAYFRSLIEHAMDAVAVLEADGTIRFQSASIERLLGFKAGDLKGKKAFDLVHRDDRPAIISALTAGQTPGASATVRFRIRHRDRSWRIFEAAGRNLLHDPAIAGIVVNSRDITERVAAEEALRRSEAALQRRRAELRALAAGLLTAQEQERSRISRELHDDLNQRLAMLAVDIQALEAQPATPPESIRQQLHSLHDRIAALSDDVRRMAYDLHPSILEHLGLTATLQSHCREFAKREGIRVLFRRRRVPAAIPQEAAVCLYRIAQESLRNVARHSGAERATVTLTGTVGGIRLSVRDSGAGFDLRKAKRKGRLGIVSMEERARLVNGTILLKSAPGEGTEVVFFVPLPRGKP